jgi:hypothetical protein
MVVKKSARAIMNHSFTCQNPSCGKVFPKPIKASNLRLKKVEVYDACPHCLAKIAEKEIPLTNEGELDLKVEDARNDGELTLSLPIINDKSVERSSKIQCTHHFGYLSQRPKKESIPEECIVCERIVKCMLKNVTG